MVKENNHPLTRSLLRVCCLSVFFFFFLFLKLKKQTKKKTVVQTFTIPLKMIAGDLFNQSSDALIKRYNDPGDDALAQSTQENIIAVLFHRSDSNARKFIKQHSGSMSVRVLESRRKRNATALTLIKRGLDLHAASLAQH